MITQAMAPVWITSDKRSFDSEERAKNHQAFLEDRMRSDETIDRILNACRSIWIQAVQQNYPGISEISLSLFMSIAIDAFGLEDLDEEDWLVLKLLSTGFDKLDAARETTGVSDALGT